MPKFDPNTATQLLDTPNMLTDDHDKAATVHLSLQGDNAVVALQNKSQTSAGIATGSWGYFAKGSTNSSGVATIYMTSDGTSGGTASFGSVYEDGIVAMPVGADNYQVTSCVLSGDKKSIAVTLNKISTVLGLLTFSSTAGAGVEVRAAVWGK